MTEDDPRRLKHGGEAPPELVRALNALGRDRDAARLARVAEKLGKTLAGAPPPAAATTSGASKLLGLKTILTGLVIGAAMVSIWVWRSSEIPAEPARVLEAPRAESVAVPAATVAPPASPPAPAEPSVATGAAKPAASSSSESPRRALRTRNGTATTSNAPSPSANTRSASETAAADAPSDPGARSATDPAAREEPAPRKPRDPRLEPPPKEAPRVRSEVGLLFEARKAMSSQPLAALSLIDEHAAHYPSGQLAPEREVLRIEALRKLGRTAEADRQLRQFQSRYPKSIHLRRLEGVSGSTLTP